MIRESIGEAAKSAVVNRHAEACVMSIRFTINGVKVLKK